MTGGAAPRGGGAPPEPGGGDTGARGSAPRQEEQAAAPGLISGADRGDQGRVPDAPVGSARSGETDAGRAGPPPLPAPAAPAAPAGGEPDPPTDAGAESAGRAAAAAPASGEPATRERDDGPNPNVRENPDGSRWIWDGSTWHFVPAPPGAPRPHASRPQQAAGPRYAGYWRRALAAILDLALLLPLYWFASTALLSSLVPELRRLSGRGTEAASAWLQDGNWDRLLAPLLIAWLVVLAVVPVVDAVAISRRGATFGRRHAGVSVVTASGGKPDFARAWRRSLVRLPTVALFGLPAIVLVFSAEKAAIHDRVAGTRVIVATTPPRPVRARL